MIYRKHNQQQFLSNAKPLESLHRVRVLAKGKEVATMAGRDLDELKARAFRFATAQGWRRPVVEVLR